LAQRTLFFLLTEKYSAASLAMYLRPVDKVKEKQVNGIMQAFCVAADGCAPDWLILYPA
jgi:hypothetical protein